MHGDTTTQRRYTTVGIGCGAIGERVSVWLIGVVVTVAGW